MAIAFVGSIAGNYTTTSAQTIAFSTLRDESNVQPTLLQNDIIIACLGSSSTTDRTQASQTATGYTTDHTDLYANGTNDANLQVMHKFMGASPDANISLPGGVDFNSPCAYALFAFRGVDLTTPMDVAPVVKTVTNTGIPNCDAITPATAGAAIIAVGAACMASAQFAALSRPANLSSTTNHFRESSSNNTRGMNIGVGLSLNWASGAFDPNVFGGGNSNSANTYCAVTLALRPAAGALSPPPLSALRAFQHLLVR